MTVVIEYTPLDLPSSELLQRRAHELQHRLPGLAARLANVEGDEAHWIESEPWPSDEVVRDEALSEDAHGLLEVMQVDMDRMGREDIVTRPLWQVARCTNQNVAYLVLSVNHILNDGKGTFNLLSLLLAPSVEAVSRETFDAPWAEEVVDMIPTEPVKLSYEHPPWPVGHLRRRPRDCSSAFALFALDAELMAALKIAGKAKGVSSLDPILRAAGVIALHSVLNADLAQPTPLQSMYAYTFRHQHPGVSFVTGSFHVPLVSYDTPALSNNFWAFAIANGEHTRNDVARALGRHLVGNTVHLPRPLHAHYTQVWDGPAPYRASVAFSNMAYLKLPPGATDLAWIQTNGINFPAICTELIGHDGGSRITVGWREGSVVNRQEVNLFIARWTSILRKVAARVGEDWTVEQLMDGLL